METLTPQPASHPTSNPLPYSAPARNAEAIAPPAIRSLVQCVFRRESSIFVSRGFDSNKRETFYRPIGGEIEFGEYAQQAAPRVVMARIGAEIRNLKVLGTLENIFVHNGRPGHELITLFEADFVHYTLYQDRKPVWINGVQIIPNPTWKPLEIFIKNEAPLYPDGLLDLLRKKWKLAH